MTFQVEVYSVLTKSARIMETLAGDVALPEDAHLVAAKFTRAAETVGQEPLSLDAIGAARVTVKSAKEALERLNESAMTEASRLWLWTAIEGFNCGLNLLTGMQHAYKAIPATPAEAKTKNPAFRKLIPSSWWGSR